MTADRRLGGFEVPASDQERFARLSGDWNPIHVDARTGRRSIFGDVVVHGVNTLLRALEMASRDGQEPIPPLAGISVRFLKPAFVGERLEVFETRRDARGARLSVRAGQSDLVRITTTFAGGSPGEQAFAELDAGAREAPERRTPACRSMSDGDGLQVTLPLRVDATDLNADYRDLIKGQGERRVAGLALLSTLVGMDWPGLNSLFTEARIDFRQSATARDSALYLAVASADAERGITTAMVEGPDFTAQVSAFFRPPPVVQPGCAELMDRIEPAFLKSWTAVVVGGSRGLGEIGAKLSAAAGADTIITYRSAEAEARAVQADIAAAGRRCVIVRHDVVADRLTLPADVAPQGPVLFLYCASPHIFRRRTDAFSRAWLDEFLKVYVDGFVSALDAVKRWSPGPIAILYPSSQALDKPMAELVEYSAAKAAGEAVCRALVDQDRRLTAEIPRLPRLLTDQTNSIVQVETDDPVNVLIPVIRTLAALR